MENVKPRRGRPVGRTQRTEFIRAQVKPEVKEWLEQYAYDKDVSSSRVIAQAVEEMMIRLERP